MPEPGGDRDTDQLTVPGGDLLQKSGGKLHGGDLGGGGDGAGPQEHGIILLAGKIHTFPVGGAIYGNGNGHDPDAVFLCLRPWDIGGGIGDDLQHGSFLLSEAAHGPSGAPPEKAGAAV